MIKQRTLGRTGLKISELCLGTLNFGWKTDEKISFAILDAYFALGGNFIQATSHTSELTLPSTSSTLSEVIVGRWWRARGLRREDLFLATRIHVRQPEAGSEAAFVRAVRQACQDSLTRLQTHYLDLVVFEWNDGLMPIRATLAAFDHVVRGGLVRFLGAGGFPTWRVSDALGRAYLRNHCRLEAMQADYSLMTRARFEPEAMALCHEQRLAFFARAPLAGGFLARRGDVAGEGFGGGAWGADRFGNGYGAMALAALADVASRHGANTGQVALAWVLHNPVVTSAMIGVRSVAQLMELTPAGGIQLTEHDLDQLHRATTAEEVRVTSAKTTWRAEPGELLLR